MQKIAFCLLAMVALAAAIPQVDMKISLEPSADQINVDVAEAPQEGSKPKPGPAPPAPLPTCNATTGAECMDQSSCCTWCATPFNLTAGWCMATTATPVPFLMCKAAPNTCHKAKTEAECGEEFACEWEVPVPKAFGAKPEEGSCVFNPLACRKPKKPKTPKADTPAALPEAAEEVDIDVKVLSKESSEESDSLQVSKPKPGPAPPAPLPTCNATTGAECMDQSSCCTWCATPFNLTAGWCMATTATPIPFLMCKEAPNTCHKATTEEECAEEFACEWEVPVPKAFGAPKPAKGSCVFNPLACRKPKKPKTPKADTRAVKPAAAQEVSVNVKVLSKMYSKESNSFAMQAQHAIQEIFGKKKPSPAPKPPAPTTGACNATTAAECLMDGCCDWCMTPFNMTKGWCMSSSVPIPFLQCKAGESKCSSLKTAKKCEAEPHCSWSEDLAKGWASGVPPHAGGCTFDASTCK